MSLMIPSRLAVASAFFAAQLGWLEAAQSTPARDPTWARGFVAVVAKKVEPEYTPEARAAGLQGSVVLYVEISRVGEPETVHVIQSLGMGLDEKAVEAVQQWRFRPGMRNGTPAKVEQSVEVSFLLQPAASWRIRRCSYKTKETNIRARDLSDPMLEEYVSPAPQARASNRGVIVDLNITKRGKTENSTILEERGAGLGSAALAAISSWKFRPGTRNGKPTEASGLVEMECQAAQTSEIASSTEEASGSVLRIGKEVSAPAIIHKVEAEYSDEARKERRSGSVVLSNLVDKSGHAVDMSVIHPLGLGLDEKAMRAINQWRFKPGTKDGKPVTVVAQVEVNFRLL